MSVDLIGTWERPLAVVTGAAGGMGRAVARRLGARYRLVLADVHEEGLERVAESLTEEGYDVARSLLVDVGDRASIEALADATARSGRLGTLAHLAGVSPTMTDWKTLLRVNLTGTAHVLDAFLPLAEPGSVAVCISSIAAYNFRENPEVGRAVDDPYAPDLADGLERLLRPLDTAKNDTSFGLLAYGASKLGVIRLVEGRVWEWAERGARIVSVAPGVILTPMLRQEFDLNPAAAETAGLTPLQRFGTSMDIAATVDFLSSDLAGYITGSDIRVDGGIVAAKSRPRRR